MKKFANEKYKVYETHSDVFLLDGGPDPERQGGYWDFLTIERYKGTVMLNNIKVGTTIVGRKISRESLTK